MRLLSRREHGARELAEKLARKGYGQLEIDEVLAECQRLGLQDDERFTESVCRARVRQGYGPLKIIHELQAKQIARELIDKILEQEKDNWLNHALAVWEKKYKNKGVLSFVELGKRQRFLAYRGFPADIIAKLIKE